MCEESGFPLLGDKFPKMKVQTTHGEKELPKDYKGKWFVLFSHPIDSFTLIFKSKFSFDYIQDSVSFIFNIYYCLYHNITLIGY